MDAALWDAAHGVLVPRRVAYLRGVRREDEGTVSKKGLFLGRPEGTIESRYLLSGLARCGGCGGSIYGLRKTSRAHVRDYYGCFYHRTRGALACANGLTLPQDEADPLVLDVLRRDVLAPEAVARTVADTLAAWRAQTAGPAARETIAARLAVLERELRALTDTLARGAAFDSVAEAIAAREQERDVLRRQQAAGDERTRIAGLDPSRVAAELTARLADWDGLLRRHPQQARQILKKLLAGRLVFDPFEDARGQGYVIRGQAASGRLIASGVRLGVPPG